MSRSGQAGLLARTALLLFVAAVPAAGHSGPPFPIASDRIAGPYRISVWTDPDATDDRTPGGQFWVIVHSVRGGGPVAGARVAVLAQPLDRTGPEQRADALPQAGDPSRHAASLVLDHEGRWRVQVLVDSSLGPASASAEVSATYDLRPPVGALPFLLLPFVLVGFLWLKALRVGRRRRAPSRPLATPETPD